MNIAEEVMEQGTTEITAEDMMAAMRDEITALKGALDAERLAQVEIRAQLDAAKKMLANPAFCDARIVGSPNAGFEGGAIAGNGEMYSEAEAKAIYNTLVSAESRAAFRRNNWRVLGIAPEGN